MRPVKPATATGPRYPRFGVAWRLLAGAPLALAPLSARADATVPRPLPGGQQRPVQPPPVPGEIVRIEPPAPPPTKNPRRAPVPPQLKGKMIRPDPPEPPPHLGGDEARPTHARTIVVHPHGFDQPCALITDEKIV